MPEPATLALWAVLIAASSAGLVVAVRALPPVERLMERGVKPWACDVCSSFWATAIMMSPAGLLWGPWALVSIAPAYTLSYWLVRELGAPTSLPPPPEAPR